MKGYQIRRDEHAAKPKNPTLGDVDKLNAVMHEKAHTMHVHSVKAKTRKVTPRKELGTSMTRSGEKGKKFAGKNFQRND